MKLAVGNGIANCDTITFLRIVGVDVPVVDAAMDFDFLNDILNGVSVSVACDFKESQNWFCAMPVTGERDFRSLNSRPGDFPVGLHPK